jgi:hypothetical protein
VRSRGNFADPPALQGNPSTTQVPTSCRSAAGACKYTLSSYVCPAAVHHIGQDMRSRRNRSLGPARNTSRKSGATQLREWASVLSSAPISASKQSSLRHACLVTSKDLAAALGGIG